MQEEQSHILARLARLETQNRRLKKGGTMLMLLCGAFLAMGQAGPSDDGASPESSVLRDATGRKRLFLGVTENGAAVVRLRDASSKAVAMLRMSADGVFSFECGDMKGSLRAMLQVRSHGPTVFRLLDHTQRYESRMTVDTRGSTLKLGRRGSRRGVLLQGGQGAGIDMAGGPLDPRITLGLNEKRATVAVYGRQGAHRPRLDIESGAVSTITAYAGP